MSKEERIQDKVAEKLGFRYEHARPHGDRIIAADDGQTLYPPQETIFEALWDALIAAETKLEPQTVAETSPKKGESYEATGRCLGGSRSADTTPWRRYLPYSEFSPYLLQGEAKVSDSVYQNGGGKDFVVFNDGELTMEPITAEDLTFITVPKGSRSASEAWSCAIDWYFIVTPTGIILCNVHREEGVFCRKRSAKFIEMFLEHRAPRKRKAGTQ